MRGLPGHCNIILRIAHSKCVNAIVIKTMMTQTLVYREVHELN